VTSAGEPKEMQIRMQYIQSENEFSIYGTASNIEEDLLQRLCESETQVYKIENYMIQIDLLGRRISEAILKYSNPDDVFMMKLCLMELLVNAMEHGNLGITFQQKTTALENGSYYELLYERQHSPEYKNRRILIEYSLDPYKVEIRITDEGNGFDHKKHIYEMEANGISNTLAHGRGLQLAKGFFNLFEYNENGNSISLVKNFK
jgi:two-component sensor histidine kinase